MYNLLERLVIIVIIIAGCIGEIIKLEQGRLIGTTGTDRNGNTFYSFLSIPFAKPPIGKLRFADPLPPTPWRGILNATTDLPSCPQFDGQIVGQEDCLYLNVHTPNFQHGVHPKPVIVFIHGGSLIEGSGTSRFYGGKFFMPADIVLVTINYRLGLLGFLNSQNRNLKIPGNAALKDQTMALKWVKKNIAKFGGDPDNVTLMGQSSGGLSVHAHIFSNLDEGLFHRVIVMSSAIGNLYGKGVTDSMKTVAQRLGINGSDDDIFTQLRNLPFRDIVAANQFTTIPINAPVEPSPILEYHHPNAFFTVDPSISLKTGKYTQVPVMLGYTNNEGLFIQTINRLVTGQPFIIEDFGDFIPYNLNLTPTQREDLKREIKEFYFGNEESTGANLDKATKLVTDAVFIAGIEETLRTEAVTQTMAPLYVYVFSADTEMNYFKRLSNETANVPGASHVDDLGYAFDNIYTPVIKPGSPEDTSVTNYINLLTSFARDGKPDKKFHWKPYTIQNKNYLDIAGVNSFPKTKPDDKSFRFWKGVYDRYGSNPRFVAK